MGEVTAEQAMEARIIVRDKLWSLGGDAMDALETLRHFIEQTCGEVSVSRENAHKINEMLKYYFEKHPTDDDEARALVNFQQSLKDAAQ